MSQNFHSPIRQGPGHARPVADRLTVIVICCVILLIIMYFVGLYLVSAG